MNYNKPCDCLQAMACLDVGCQGGIALTGAKENSLHCVVGIVSLFSSFTGLPYEVSIQNDVCVGQ